MAPQRKHGWLFWFAVVLIALPILYVASFGPACWVSAMATPDSEVLAVAYHPLWWAIWARVPFVETALTAYATWGLQEGTILNAPTDDFRFKRDFDARRYSRDSYRASPPQ